MEAVEQGNPPQIIPEIMGNTHNNSDMNLPPSEKNNIKYHKWIDDIYKEIRYVYLKTNEHHINVLKLLDKFLEKFRQCIQRKHGHSTRMHDYHLVRETNRLMFLIRDLFSERNDQDYLMKTSEILGGCTFLWLRYHSLEDEQYNETHIEEILNCYAIHLQSTTDESFLLKIITHALYVCKKLPRIFYKILEMHLKRRVQRKGRRNLEAKEDQLYILYIIAFKLWDRLQPDGEDKMNIAQYANNYIKPMHSLLSNPRYVPNLPKITSEDIKCGRATKIVINNLPPSKILKLAEAVVKEDWLKGSDINAPITVDLSIDDDLNRSEQAVENDQTFISVNTELRDLSLEEKQSNLSKELWRMKVLQKRARKNINTSRKENYRVIEVIVLDDEDVDNCDSTSETNVEMEAQNQSKATQSKEAEIVKTVGQKQISNEENIQINRQEPQKNKEANSNSGENICKRRDTTQEKDDNCETIIVQDHVLEDELNSCNKFTGATEKEVDVGKKSQQLKVVNTKRQNTQELRNEFKSIEETTKSLPKKIIDNEKDRMVSKKDTQVIQIKSMETDSAEETSEMSGSKDLQLQHNKQPRMVNIDRRKSVLKEKSISHHETCSEFELNDTQIEVTSKKGNHSIGASEENSDVNAISKDLNELELQNKEKTSGKNSRQIKNITPMVEGAIEAAETSEDDEVTSIICVGESNPKSPIVLSESDGSEAVCINTEDKNNDCKQNLKSCSLSKAVDENDLEHISDRPNDPTHEKSIHIIDAALNSSGESLEINGSPDDERAIDDTISISSTAEESENYKYMKDRVVLRTSTANTKIRSSSPNYTFIPTPDMNHDEIKSPPVESFSKSDSDEFTKIFNNKNHLNTHRHKKGVVENNTQAEEKNEHTVGNLTNNKTNQVTKRSILTKTDGNIQNENPSTSKQKDVSLATVTQNKEPLFLNRSANLDSTIIERKTYDSLLTIQNEPQNWRSSVKNSPPLSNQQDQELELLSTNDVNSLGSSSPPSMKDSGMTQNMFQFENDTKLSVFNDDAVGNNTEVLPNKSCESYNNLVSATDLSISSNTLRVRTDLMSSNSELNNAEEDSVSMIGHCDNESDEKKLQNSLPLKKRRKLSRDGNSFCQDNCKNSDDNKAFDYYDKQIAYPAERCMSILQFLDISQRQTTFFVNNNSSITIINNSPSQQTVLTGGNGFDVIAQQQKVSSTTPNNNVYPNIPVQRDMNEEILATPIEVTSKKGNHSIGASEENSDVNAISKDLTELELQNKEKTSGKNSRQIKNITPMVEGAIEAAETSEDDEVTSIICVAEPNPKSPIVLSESDGSEAVCINTEDKNNDCKQNLKSCSLSKAVDENDLEHLSDRPNDPTHEKSIHIIDAALNSSGESLEINGSPDDERAIDDTISISSTAKESENYKYMKDRVVSSTITANAKNTADMDHDEIKSPPVESFSKSDSDEFKKIFNNKNHLNTHRHKKEVIEDNTQAEEKKEHTVENLINKKANQITKRSILTKTDGNIQNENPSTSKQKDVSYATPPPMKESDQEWNQEDNSDITEDATSIGDVNTLPLEESLSDNKGIAEHERSPLRRNQFATPSQLHGNPIKNTKISSSFENVSSRVSFTRESTISPSVKNVEVLDKISSIHQPYQALSDFDRYLVGIKKANRPQLHDSLRKPLNLKVDRRQILKSDQSYPCESVTMMSRITQRSRTPLPSIKAHETVDKNNFERITSKDPKLKKRVVVQLKNYTSSELKKIMNSNRRRSSSESSSVMNSDIENNRRALSALFRRSETVSGPTTEIRVKSRLTSPTRYKEPTFIFRDVNGLRPMYLWKRRKSAVPEIVVQVFRDKNKKHLNPCVMLKKLDLDALDSHINEKERHKHKKKDKSRRKSRSKRTSDDEDEMTDSSIGERYCTKRSISRTPYSWEKTNNHNNILNGLPRQSETELDESQNEVSEINPLHPSNKRRLSRSKSGSRSRSRSKSKSRKRKDSKFEFSETDLFLSLERGRSRSRSKSKGRGRSKSTDTQADYSDVESTSSKKHKSKSGKRAPTHNKKIINLMLDDDHERTSSSLHFYHEFGYVSSDEETLNIKRQKHDDEHEKPSSSLHFYHEFDYVSSDEETWNIKRQTYLKMKAIDGSEKDLNIRDKPTSPVTLPFDLNRPLSSTSLSEDELSTSGSPARLISDTSRVRRISDIDINFERTHQMSFKEFSDQFSNVTLLESKLNSAQLIPNENVSDSDKKKRKSSSSTKSDLAETVNINKTKTYSKSNLVQNVFVPAEHEKNFDNPSQVGSNYVQSQKDMSNLDYSAALNRVELQDPIVQDNKSVIDTNQLNNSENPDIATQRTHTNILESPSNKGNKLNNMNFLHQQRNNNKVQNSQPSIDYKHEKISQCENQNRIEIEKNKTPNSPLNDQGRDIPESKRAKLKSSRELTSIEESQKLAKLPDVDMDHNNLIYEHTSNYFHNNFAKKRALLHEEDERYFSDNSKKQSKLEKKCESRGKPKKSKNNLTDRITRSSNRTLPVNYKDDGLVDNERETKVNRDGGTPVSMNQTPNSMNGNILQCENLNRMEIEKNETPTSPLIDQGRDIAESKGPNLKLARKLAPTEEDQNLSKQQLLDVNMDHYNFNELESNHIHNTQIKYRDRGRLSEFTNLAERLITPSKTILPENYGDTSNMCYNDKMQLMEVNQNQIEIEKNETPNYSLNGQDLDIAESEEFTWTEDGQNIANPQLFDVNIDFPENCYIDEMQSIEANQNQIEIEKDATSNFPLNDQSQDIAESKDPNVNLGKELTSTEEGQNKANQQLLGKSIDLYDLKELEPNYILYKQPWP